MAIDGASGSSTLRTATEPIPSASAASARVHAQNPGTELYARRETIRLATMRSRTRLVATTLVLTSRFMRLDRSSKVRSVRYHMIGRGPRAGTLGRKLQPDIEDGYRVIGAQRAA